MRSLSIVALAMSLLIVPPFRPTPAWGIQETESSFQLDLAPLKPGLQTITLEKVKDTVSYLASDEMAGRATLTPGFDKAVAYVEGRFKKAGLQPVKGEGFFHETEVTTTRTPDDEVSLTIDGKVWETWGLLSGGAEALSGSFPWQEVSLGDREIDDVAGIAVCQLEENADSSRWLAQLARLSNRVRLAGGKALILQVSEDNGILELAKRLRQPQFENDRTRFMIPVVLMNSKEFPAEELTVNLPQQVREKTVVRNVLAMLPGSDEALSDEYLLVTAHLDHLPPKDSGEDRINNGADDNATGVTAVLTLADAYTSLPKPPARSIVFMTFWGEERGLLGSKAYVANPTLPLEKMVANVNIEMIGRPEAGAHRKVWVTGWEKSDLGPLMAQGAAAVGVTVFEHPQFSAMLYQASDNAAFAAKGGIAHSFSAGSLHSDYHQPTDEWEKLDLEHMTDVIRGLFAATYPIANGQMTPHVAGDSGGN